jgi:phage-related protein
LSGRSTEQFRRDWETNAGNVFRDFVEGLGVAGDDAIGVLSALGLQDQRLIRSFLSLAGSGDVLREAMAKSSTEFVKNTALTKEAEQRYKTTASQFKIFKNVIKDVGITIGSALLPFVNKLLTAAKPLIEELGQKLPQFLNEKLIPAIEGVAAWLGENLPIAIQFLSDFWTNTLQPALTQFGMFVTGTLIPLFQQVFTWLATNIPVALQTLSEFWTGTLQPAIETVVGFIKENLEPILAGIATVVLTVIIPAFIAWAAGAVAAAAATVAALAPILIPLAAIGAAAALIYKAWTENWGGIRDVVLPIVQAITDFITEKAQAVVAWFQENWPIIQEKVSEVLNKIQEVVSVVLAKISDLWLEHGDKVKTLINTIWTIIKGVIEQAVNFVKGVIQAALFLIQGNWEEAWNLIKDTAQNIWNAFQDFMREAGPRLWEIIRGIVRQVPEIISSIGSKVLEAGRAIVEKLKQGISDAWGAFIGWFESKLEGLTSWLPFSEPKNPASPLRGLSRAGEAIVKNITAGMASAIGQLESAQMGLASVLQQATIQTAAMPAASAAGANVSVTNQFNTSIDGGMSQAAFETGVQRVIERAIGQAV